MSKEYKETHFNGTVSIERDLKAETFTGNLDIQIFERGQVWICLDGVALIKLNPDMSKRTHLYYRELIKRSDQGITLGFDTVNAVDAAQAWHRPYSDSSIRDLSVESVWRVKAEHLHLSAEKLSGIYSCYIKG